MTERCFRLNDHTRPMDVRGEAARDALIRTGYGLVGEISCDHGTLTGSASEEYVQRGEVERQVYADLPEAEQRQLRRQVGGVQMANATPQDDASWASTKAK